MNIAGNDIDAIRTFGYTEDEARFLYIVATHSGYFVPRQFLALAGAKWGKRSTRLAEKIESRGHAAWREYQGAGGVYHLFAKRFYGQIGKENIRNRRKHSVEFIKARLVLLDFILANQHYNYLETEQEKVRYFSDQLHIPKKNLPARPYVGTSHTEPTPRYLVDKYPLFFVSNVASSSPVVTFSYVDAGLAGISGFAKHLRSYIFLFRELSEFRFVYIANSDSQFMRTSSCFSSIVKMPLQGAGSADVLSYFHLRCAWDKQEYGTLTNDDIECLNDAKKRFEGQGFEAMYRTWLSGGLSEQALRVAYGRLNPEHRVDFQTYLINGNQVNP